MAKSKTVSVFAFRAELVIPEGKFNSSRNVWQKLVDPSEILGVN